MTSDHYRAAGVDLNAAAYAKSLIARHARTTHTPQVLSNVGFLGALYHLTGFRDPVLVASTDNVGTKLKVAALAGAFESVGQDVVNQSINDVITCGARPLFFLDYIAMNRLEPERAAALVQGMAQACRAAGCALIGGETAELPGMYAEQGFDLAGFVVGAVERDAIIDGTTIQEGDILIALPSSGLHTNGYSLVRRIFDIDQNPAVLDVHEPHLGATLGQALLTPHLAYWPLLEPVKPNLKGMAHITGGGLPENLPRVLPAGLAAQVDTSSWQVPPLFQLIQERGNVPREEMFRVFNMGVGMVLVSAPEQVSATLSSLKQAWVIGSIMKHQSECRVVFQ